MHRRASVAVFVFLPTASNRHGKAEVRRDNQHRLRGRHHPDTSQVAYGTSKAAIIHLGKMIAVHAAKDNITCNVVPRHDRH